MLSWLFTVIFVLLLVPAVQRLARPEPPGMARRRRDSELAELLLTLAMVAMFSPVGGPIPGAGWQAMLLLAAVYFLGLFLRSRRAPGIPGSTGHPGHDHLAHHAVCAALMLYMVTAMPHAGADHGPWFIMSGMDSSSSLELPALAIVGAAGLAVDAALCVLREVRRSADAPAWYTRRETYRATMGLGMAYMLISAV